MEQGRNGISNLPNPSQIERLPPHSIEAEQGVLGCVMLSPVECMGTCIEKFRRGREVFYDLRHQVIFDTLVEMYDAMEPIDLITLRQRLTDRKQLEPVGGITYISALPDGVPSAANLEYYIDIVLSKFALRAMIQACTRAVARIYEDESDSEDLIALAEQEVMDARRATERHVDVGVRELAIGAVEAIEDGIRRGGAIGGAPTGYPDLDLVSDGLHNGEMIILAGYPGSGKTSLAINIAEHTALSRRDPVGIFSLEMSAQRLVKRMIASQSRVNIRQLQRLRPETPAEQTFQQECIQRISNVAAAVSAAPFHFCDDSGITIAQLRARARQMVSRHNVRLIIVDYLQLVTGRSLKDGNREQEVASISRGIKHMAGELDIPVIALSQLSEDGKLRESRAIGQDTDCVWKLLPKVNDKGEPEYSNSRFAQMILHVDKQRDGESPALVDLLFQKEFTRFESVSRVSDVPRSAPPERQRGFTI